MSSSHGGAGNRSINIAASRKYRCAAGGEWKDLDYFSRTQQKAILRQIENGNPIDTKSIKMTCREHTSQQLLELRCEVCCIKKSADEFSKIARRQDNPTCVRCTSWTETQEHQVNPVALETGHISIAEQGTENWRKGLEDTAAFFNGDVNPQAPITSLDELGISKSEIAQFKEIHGTDKPDAIIRAVQEKNAADMAKNRLPPHLQPPEDDETSEASSKSDEAPDPRIKSRLPPHLGGFMGTSSASNASLSTATTVRDDRKKAAALGRIKYNAWDSSGKRHEGIKNPTLVSDTLTGTGISGPGFLNPGFPGVDTNDIENRIALIGTYPVKAKKGNWPTVSRIPQNMLNKQPPVIRRKVDPDADEQKIMAFVDSDEE